jgi:hypothetical protein
VEKLQSELARAKQELERKKHDLEVAQSKTDRIQKSFETLQHDQQARLAANRVSESNLVRDLQSELDAKREAIMRKSVPEDLRIEKMERDLDEIKRLLKSP